MTSHAPKLEIGLPAFNAADYLSATIESLLAQDFEDWKLRVIDDASNDDTFEIASSFGDDRISVKRNEKNLGQIGNWNAVSTGVASPYFKLLCADDTLEEGCLASQVAALDAHPSASLVAGKRRVIDSTGATIRGSHGLAGLAGLVDGSIAIRKCVAAGANLLGEPPAVMLRTAALPPDGPWRTNFKYCPDLDLWLRVLAKGDLVASDEVVAAFRVHAQSDSASELSKQQSADTIACLRAGASDAGVQVSGGLMAIGQARSYTRMRLRRLLYRVLAATRERKRERA